MSSRDGQHLPQHMRWTQCRPLLAIIGGPDADDHIRILAAADR